MKKGVKLTGAALLTAAALLALGATAADRAAELRKLEEERAKLTWKMVDKRAELIEKNDECRAIHEQIMTLQRELAIKLDALPEMRQLNRQSDELDDKIAELKTVMKASGDKAPSDAVGGNEEKPPRTDSTPSR